MRRSKAEERSGPDPLPRAGLVREHERHIRKWVGRFCQQNPGANYDEMLVDAVRIAVDVETRLYNPALGNFWGYCKRALARLYRLWKKEIGPIGLPDEEDDEEDLPVVAFRGGNGARVQLAKTWVRRWDRCGIVIGLQLTFRPDHDDRSAIDTISAAVCRELDNRPLDAIRISIQDVYPSADIKFYKGAKPPRLKEPKFVSLHTVVGEDKAGRPITLGDTIASGDLHAAERDHLAGLDRAIKETPLSKNQQSLLDWRLRGGRPTHWAERNGIDGGYARRLSGQIDEKLGATMKKKFGQ